MRTKKQRIDYVVDVLQDTFHRLHESPDIFGAAAANALFYVYRSDFTVKENDQDMYRAEQGALDLPVERFTFTK